MPSSMNIKAQPHQQSTKSAVGFTFCQQKFHQKLKASVLVSALAIFPMSSMAETYHIVERGESLSALSDRFNVSVADIRKQNNIKNNNLQVGQKLLIPMGKAGTASTSGSSSAETKSTAKARKPRQTAGSNRQYTVVSGDSLSAVARKHKVSLSSLLAENELRADYLLMPNDVLLIPSSRTTKTGTKKTSDKKTSLSKSSSSKQAESSDNYTVKAGDVLVNIAKRKNVSVADIKKLNKLPSDFLQIGQVLTIPPSTVKSTTGKTRGNVSNAGNVVKVNKASNNANSNASSNSTAQTEKASTYVVQAGDVLGAIADKHGVGLSRLVKLNQLEGKQNSLQVGQILKLPESKNNAEVIEKAKQPAIESKPRIRDTVDKAVGSAGY